MQQCTMNGDTFRRDDDGRLFLNGNEIVDSKVKAHKIDYVANLISTLLGVLMGMLIML